MKLAAELGAYPAGRPLNSDQILEHHAGRILLLLLCCGTKNRIQGLTKLAKLDFFVRYPSFFARATSTSLATTSEGPSDDATMVRHHYGPWDPRYYRILAYLEARELIIVERQKKTFVFTLTNTGSTVARKLAEAASFDEVIQQMKSVKRAFGSKNGTWLKNTIYQLFESEVGNLPRGELIR